MAVVGASAGIKNNSVDAMKQLQESFNEKEISESRKHREEVQDLTQAHRAEIQKLEDSTEKRLRESKERNEDALSKQEVHYQKEIKDLRDLYQKQLERNAQNAAASKRRDDSEV